MSNTIMFRSIYLPRNMGHGEARRKSLNACHNPLVALMDADDISLSDRFGIQLRKFMENPLLSIVGGQITEFIDEPDNITGIRTVPQKHTEIREYMKKRCPMNQVSVMFKKNAVEESGGYIDWYCEEDYYLWLRMMEHECFFENVPEVLVNVRTGEGMSSRRGGWKYFISESKLQKYMLKKRIISFPRYLYNTAIRFGGEVLASNNIRQKLLSYLREKPNTMVVDSKCNDSITFEDIEYPPFSVSMCVYGGDNAEWFDIALASVINQTVKPSEIVLVVDGPVPQPIKDVIKKYESICMGG